MQNIEGHGLEMTSLIQNCCCDLSRRRRAATDSRLARLVRRRRPEELRDQRLRQRKPGKQWPVI